MKLIVAVLRKEDEADTIAELNKKRLFCDGACHDRRFPEGEEHNTADRNR